MFFVLGNKRLDIMSTWSEGSNDPDCLPIDRLRRITVSQTQKIKTCTLQEAHHDHSLARHPPAYEQSRFVLLFFVIGIKTLSYLIYCGLFVLAFASIFC